MESSIATHGAATSPVHIDHEGALEGMVRLDTSRSRSIPIQMEMVAALSRAQDPKQVLRIFADGFARLHGPRGYISLSTRGLKPGQYKITRLINDFTAMSANAPDPWRDWSKLPVHEGGFLGAIIRQAYPEVIHHLNVRNDPVLGDAIAEFRSLMAIPLFDEGEPLNWSITLRTEPEGFTLEALEEAILRTNLGGATVKNVMITRQLREANERNQREVERIAQIQRALLPASLPQIPGVRIATSYETFDTAGGDLYDVTILRPQASGSTPFDGWLAFLIADAAGHGPAAAVVTAMLNALLYAYPRWGGGPADAFEFANNHLYSKRIEGTFLTAFLAVFNPDTRELVYANAGHPPPLLKVAGSGGAVTRLDATGGIPLGVLDEVEYSNASVTIRTGETLVLYTDGIPEARNPAGDMFGVEGIERALHECSGEPDCVINSITSALRAHEDGVRPGDDQTIVALRSDGA